MEPVTDIERNVFDTISKDICRLHIRSKRIRIMLKERVFKENKNDKH